MEYGEEFDCLAEILSFYKQYHVVLPARLSNNVGSRISTFYKTTTWRNVTLKNNYFNIVMCILFILTFMYSVGYHTSFSILL